MAKGRENQRGNTSQNYKDKSLKKDGHTKNERKRGWSHIIDKIDYSSGPGDNIYVFG